MRVIGGALGGRRLASPPGRATRPTSDRVREALFNVLGDVAGAVVLDLYAGTGALAIEALSRGASRAVLVDNGRPALVVLRDNIASLGLGDRTKVLPLPALRAVSSLRALGPFDLVLIDPPYAELDEAIDVLVLVAPLCSADATIVLEHASRDAPDDVAGLRRVQTRVYGDSALSLYKREDNERKKDGPDDEIAASVPSNGAGE